MERNKKAGIWMDYSIAYVTELKNHMLETTIIYPVYADPVKPMDANRNGDNADNREEKFQHSSYYSTLSEIISLCDEVILFGPNDAKWELLQVLRANHLFANTKIVLKPAADMTKEEQHRLFRKHFMREEKNNV